MSKFNVNYVTLVEKGMFGPWGYALLSAKDIDTAGADTIELRGLSRAALEAIASTLPAIKTEGLILSFDADVRTEIREENFTTKGGESATKKVMRIYLESTPVWSKISAATDLGNLADILGKSEHDSF